MDSAKIPLRGANRSTKVAGKLQVLPEGPTTTQEDNVQSPHLKLPPKKPGSEAADSQGTTGDSDDGDVDDDEEENLNADVEVYNQLSLIPDGTAKRDALRLTKKKAKSLPRVTAYSTANSYRIPELMKFFNARRTTYHTDAKLIDDVIYTPYKYSPGSSSAAINNNYDSTVLKDVSTSAPTGDLLGIPELVEGDKAKDHDHTISETDFLRKKHMRKRSRFDAAPTHAEIFVFVYGTVVIWGMTASQEKRFLTSIKRFEIDRLAPENIEMEDLNYYFANYSRIYNDVITLRKGSSYMTKLSLSYALSQSVKISLFEQLISDTIEETKDIPDVLSATGKIGMPHKEIMMKIGQLFLLRTNINSVGSVLDSPEVFWSFPDLQPLYDACRTYLEIPQRIQLLNTRLEVVQDMLQLLKESVSHRHSDRLEQVVIILIAIEIVLGIATILVDLYL